MSISVIITYYKQPLEILENHVIKCMESKLPVNEIIVVNDGSNIDCIPILKKIKKKIRLVYANIDKDILWNQPGARNLGLILSSSNYISSEDLDSYPKPDFYKIAMEKLLKSRSVRFHSNAVFMEDVQKFNYNPGSGIFLKSALVSVGCWDEDFSGHYGYDDIWLNYNIDKKFGKPIVVTDELLEIVTSGRTMQERDLQYNKQLLADKIANKSKPTSILRFPYTITII